MLGVFDSKKSSQNNNLWKTQSFSWQVNKNLLAFIRHPKNNDEWQNKIPLKECLMKRLVSILSLSVFLGISGLFASVDSSKVESKFTQADSHFLFGT